MEARLAFGVVPTVPETPKASPPAAATRPTQSSAPQEPEKATYSVDELVDDARGLVNASPAAVRGALGGHRKKNFELDEAAKLVKAWQGKTVEVDQGEPEPEEADEA